MNRIMQEKWSWVDGSHGLRKGLMDMLTDADLTFNPGGTNMTLGELCREMGEVQHAYNESFKTFTTDFAYRNPGVETSVEKLKTWFAALDAEMEKTLSAFSDEDLSKTIDRGGGYQMPVELQVEVYLQALLIFFGKASIYAKAMNKTLPESFQSWIG